ncbi:MULTISPECIES: YidC/Oxa1 family membrane protein insertase [Lachnospiraceae]|jgi:YidC/Oxa1 family membrane protein insertase|uniref:YidC/Oxa1 family membrane protein insertase n=1 Tax=Faecalicatena acetigenes TaxID=2981790 RepID=A0ABT2TDR3_9FIRM|nr:MULTISPECIES: YidC/Oxa1 family membrane protein insertase [Lachnospiraceae]MCU6748366.1 YidC/Oxa1 family membrane protein insertase [Faecalicatena acetigenes]RGT73866.1 membrane protein insertase YidC [Ruminococcus sp. AF18-22]SCI40312.1 SynYidC [uncultured Clostridium sp.]
MYGILAVGYGDWPIIKQIAWLLGKLMNGIYNVMNAIGIQNIGICIIIFTIIIYTLMIPLTIKQQKWSKMSAVMQPDIRKIQKKYAGKRDQASMLKQQEEMQIIYEKYGTSPTGGCLPMLIQMPILFALYPVVSNIPKYVQGVKDVYMPVVNQIMATDGFQKIMEKIGEASPVLMSPKSYDYSKVDTIVNALYKFQDSTWNTLVDKMPSLSEIVNDTVSQVGHLNTFLGINIGEQPLTMLMSAFHDFSIIGIIMAVIIPLMAGLTQFISVKLQPQPAMQDNGDNPMAGSMKTMIYTMPLISVVFGFTLPAGLGLYWAASALVRCVQQLAINKYLSKKTVEELIEENQKKAAKKREKKGTSAQEINRMATQSTRNVTAKKKSNMSDSEKEEKLKKAAEYSKNAKPGSLAAKANLVSRYNGNDGISKEKTKKEDSDK